MTGHQRTHASAADFRTNVLCVRNTPRRRVQAAVVLFCIFRGLAGNSVDVLSDHQEKEPPNRSAAAVVAKSSHIHSVSFIPSTHSLVGWLARSLFLFLFGSLYLRLTIASPFFPFAQSSFSLLSVSPLLSRLPSRSGAEAAAVLAILVAVVAFVAPIAAARSGLCARLFCCQAVSLSIYQL